MEDYEKFKLNKSNVIMIVITTVLLIILIIVSILLFNSLKKPNQGLPSLNITQGRYTTHSTTAGTGTTTTTTTKVIREQSPYYDVDIESLLSEEIYKKQDLTRDEAIQVGEGMFKIINSLMDFTDNSVWDMEVIVNSIKEGEEDIVEDRGTKYGQLYNFDKFIDKVFTRQAKSTFYGYQYKKKSIFLKRNDKIYRILNPVGDSQLTFVDVSLNDYNKTNINVSVRYYNTNYKELGYTAPNYKTTTLSIGYEDGWKFRSYKFPLFD